MSASEHIEISLRLRLATAEALVHKVLAGYAAMTSEEFGNGGDRELREDMARFLGLNPNDYCIWVTAEPVSHKHLSRQARAVRRNHQARMADAFPAE